VSVPREFAKKYDLPESHIRGLRVAFERKLARNANPQAEFLAPGHPIFEALVAHFGAVDELPYKAILVDPEGRHGSLWVYRVKVMDGNRTPVLERLLAFFRDHRTGEVSTVDPPRGCGKANPRSGPWRSGKWTTCMKKRFSAGNEKLG